MSQSWMVSRYTELVRRLERLDQKAYDVEEIGIIDDYLIFLVRTKPAEGKPTILLTAGIHGDEPAGPEAILQALESGFLEEWSSKFNFSVMPCINPTGYDLGTRENEKGVDVNRTFDRDDVVESALVKRFLRGKRFDLFIEFHEDWEYDGYYLYELSDQKRFGREIIKELEKNRLGVHRGEADGRRVADGIVTVEDAPPEASKVMPLYIYGRNSGHIITSESPSKLDMESRIRMHLIALSVSLEQLGR